jgi:methyl-accepting chemotaxis protein
MMLNFFKTRWMNNSLFNRTLFSIMMITFAIMVIASTLDYYVKSQEIHGKLTDKTKIIAQRLENSIRIPLWNLNFRQIDTILEIELQEKDINAILVTKSVVEIPGKIRAADEIVEFDPNLHSDIISNSFYKTKTPVSFDDKLMGIVEVYYTDTHIKKELYTNLLKDIGIIFLFGVMVFIVEFIVLRFSVLIPIQDLQRNVHKIAEKKFDTRITVRSSDEIGQLAISFNDMIERIEDYSRNMEELVQKRTDQLVRSAKLASLGSMVTGVAHEINTPVGVCLTAVTHAQKIIDDVNKNMTTQTLKRTDLISSLNSIHDTLNITESNLNRTSELVESFKQVAGDREQEQKREIKVKHFILEVLESNKDHYMSYNYELLIDCSDELVMVNYPKLFQTLLEILLSNSILHGFDKKRHGE